MYRKECERVALDFGSRPTTRYLSDGKDTIIHPNRQTIIQGKRNKNQLSALYTEGLAFCYL